MLREQWEQRLSAWVIPHGNARIQVQSETHGPPEWMAGQNESNGPELNRR